MEMTTAISAASAVGALTAAYFAARSSGAARRSAHASEQQAELAFVESVRRWRPPITMNISSVKYRWSTDSAYTQLGASTDPGVTYDEKVTRKGAAEGRLCAEVVICGELFNTTPDSALLTIRRSKDSDIRYPLQNEGLFLVDGQDRNEWPLAAGGQANFTWIDRRSFEAWRHLYVATQTRNIWSDADLRTPSLHFWAGITSAVRKFINPSYDVVGRWKEHIVTGSGFKVVADNRTVERVSTVWCAALSKAPIEAFGRDADSGDLTWRLCRDPTGNIDDDIVHYRCYPDTTLAQISPPNYRAVPGRL